MSYAVQNADSRSRQAANWTSSLGTLSAQTASGRYLVLLLTQFWSLWKKPAERELTPTDWKWTLSERATVRAKENVNSRKALRESTTEGRRAMKQLLRYLRGAKNTCLRQETHHVNAPQNFTVKVLSVYRLVHSFQPHGTTPTTQGWRSALMPPRASGPQRVLAGHPRYDREAVGGPNAPQDDTSQTT